MATKKSDPCWDGYTQVGMKMKNGKKVPNCVPAKGVPKSKKQTKKKVSKQMCAACGCGKKKGEPGFGKGPKAKKACTCGTCKACKAKKKK